MRANCWASCLPTNAPCGSALPPATACASKPGLCLHGNDITPDTDPATAGLMWAVPKDLRADGKFIGAAALARNPCRRAEAKSASG